MTAQRCLIILGILAIGLAGCSEERKREAARLERLASGDSTAIEDTVLAAGGEEVTSAPVDSSQLTQSEPQAQTAVDSQLVVPVNQTPVDSPVTAGVDSTAVVPQPQPATGDSVPDVNAIPKENGHSTIAEPPRSEMPRRPVSVYTVQVGSAGSEAEASTYLAKYRQDGYEPYIATVTSGGRDLYRIRIGKFATSQEAAQLRDELSAKYGVKPWVDKITE